MRAKFCFLFFLLLVFIRPTQSQTQSSPQYYDVTKYGAKCDSVTDDTLAFKEVRTAVLSRGGIEYIPPPKVYGNSCKVDLSAFNNTTNFNAWLVVIDDAPLLTKGMISNSKLVAIEGRQGSFTGQGGDYFGVPQVAWQAQSSFISAIQITDSSSIHISGIDFHPSNVGLQTAPTVSIDDANPTTSTEITIENSSALSNNCHNGEVPVSIIEDPSVEGYGYKFPDFTAQCTDGSGATNQAFHIENAGDVRVGGDTNTWLLEGGIYLYCNSCTYMSGFYFDHVQTEGVNEPFLTLQSGAEGEFYDITLNQIAMADNPPNSFAIRVESNDVRDILVAGTSFTFPGSGQPFFDPASHGSVFSFVCFGNPNCPTSAPPGLLIGGFTIPGMFGKNAGESPTFFTNGTDPALTTSNLTILEIPVASLPAATSHSGVYQTVSDSTDITSEGQACVGGGTNTALAFSNGTLWKCF